MSCQGYNGFPVTSDAGYHHEFSRLAPTAVYFLSLLQRPTRGCDVVNSICTWMILQSTVLQMLLMKPDGLRTSRNARPYYYIKDPSSAHERVKEGGGGRMAQLKKEDGDGTQGRSYHMYTYMCTSENLRNH